MGKVKFGFCFVRLAFFSVLALFLVASGIAASINPSTLTPHRKTHPVTENQHAKKRMRTLARSRVPRSHYATTAHSAGTSSSRVARHHRYYERFYTSSFASDIT